MITVYTPEGIPMCTHRLPDPPQGFRWALGGWMGSTPECPWPRLEPDPDVSITLTAESWRGICSCLMAVGVGDVRPEKQRWVSLTMHEAVGFAREINRCLPDGQGYQGILECPPGCTVHQDRQQ